MTVAAIEARNLSKSFRVRRQRRTSFKERVVRGRAPEPELFWALRDASFVVYQGSSLGLIGQNGSGKSTALKVLTGIYRPTQGSVSVNGSVSALLEVGAGFHPELTGRENIRLNATILGFTGREIDRLMDQIIEFADIGDHIEGPIKHYSSGMYVRLGFSVAVMVRPQILLVDEVIAVGDEEFQRKCFGYLHDLRRAGTSMIVVSHGLGNITELCDEAVWLDHGRVRGIGPARTVVRSYLDDVNEREIARGSDEGQDLVLWESPPTTVEAAAAPDPTEDVVQAPADQAIAEVNSEAPDSPPVHKSRRGTGEIRIIGVEWLDEAGRSTSILIAGRPAVLRIHYRATTRMSEVIFGFGFADLTDQAICGVNSAVTGSWEVAPGTGFVDFHGEPWLTASGKYVVRLMIKSGAAIVDAVDEGLNVVVREADVEMAGLYLQPGSWTIDPQTQDVADSTSRIAPPVGTW